MCGVTENNLASVAIRMVWLPVVRCAAWVIDASPDLTGPCRSLKLCQIARTEVFWILEGVVSQNKMSKASLTSAF